MINGMLLCESVKSISLYCCVLKHTKFSKLLKEYLEALT
jgi:sRNA-binding regulator protein Hfq